MNFTQMLQQADLYRNTYLFKEAREFALTQESGSLIALLLLSSHVSVYPCMKKAQVSVMW